MTDWTEPGLWEQLLTAGVAERLEDLELGLLADLQPLSNADAPDRLARHLAGVVARLIEGHPEDRRPAAGVALVRSVIEQLIDLVPARADPSLELPAESAQVLQAILRRLPTGKIAQLGRPLTPILDTTLLTNAPGEPRLGHEIQAEVDSALSIDVVMAFIRRSGILPLLRDLRRHCEGAANSGC